MDINITKEHLFAPKEINYIKGALIITIVNLEIRVIN